MTTAWERASIERVGDAMRPEIEEDLLTAYALGELNAQERRIVGA